MTVSTSQALGRTRHVAGSSRRAGAATAGHVTIPQYGVGRILAVWAAVAVPMALLAWVAAPALASALGGEFPLVRALLVCLTAGLAWQFVLVMALVRIEQGTLRWPVVRDALWLRAPRSPRTGRVGGRTWLVVIPLIAAAGLKELIPALAHPASRDLGAFMGSDAGQAFLHGAWAWFAMLVAMAVFNTVLGEELLFRGFLLPRMNGVFGRFDWLANGAIFALYHLHVPWAIPKVFFDAVLYAYPTKRYRSAWIGIAVHSAESVMFTVLALVLVVGT